LLLIAVVGGKRSGKTTAVEALVNGLVKHGYKVATVKHVSEKNFTIDTQGKDTWRHARAGAKIVATVSANEIAVIRKTDTSGCEVKDIIKTFKNEAGIIILEGFRKLVKKEKSIPKIVAVKNAQEAVDAAKQFKPILAFVGPFSTKNMGAPAPYVDVLANPEKLIRLVVKRTGQKS
jgi:molybdopterin-guanine dinucleotide biosynthesis protein MobB